MARLASGFVCFSWLLETPELSLCVLSNLDSDSGISFVRGISVHARSNRFDSSGDLNLVLCTHTRSESIPGETVKPVFSAFLAVSVMVITMRLGGHYVSRTFA